jgi:RHS repeat-associated protein
VVAITGAGGATAVVERFSYDPFGKRRNANGTDDVGSYQTNNSISSAQPHRGYTGHEMLEEMGIVHMNGRLYDPRLGRVMSADPIVQAPAMSQSYNRYSYVMNGPLSLTDPSGFSWWTDLRDDWLKPAAAIVVAIYAPQISGYLWGEAYAGVACYAGVTTAQVAIVQGATAGFLAGAITGGTVESAFYGGISGAAFGSLHGMDQGVDKVIAHGLAGGVMARAQGGDFGSGFLASAFTQAASMSSVFGNPGEGTAMRAQNAIMAGIVGGTASVLGGGKFANGAVTGAMSRLLNDMYIEFDGAKNKLSIKNVDPRTGMVTDFGEYDAANNAQKSSRGKWENGAFEFSYQVPHTGGSIDGPFGSNGNYVFNVDGCDGCGIHSGRESTADLAGRQGVLFATNGCIRTVDGATAILKQQYQLGNPIRSLTVKNN